MEEIKLISRILLWSFQIAAFIAAILTWPKYKNTTQNTFLYFLGFVIIIEFLGYFLPNQFGVKSAYIYNPFIVISGFYYLFWFYKILKIKKLAIILFTVFILVIINAIFLENATKIWKSPLIILALLILINSTVFYSKLLNKKEVVYYNNNPEFWIVTGLIIFHIGILPLFLFQKYLGIGAFYFRITIAILNLILYGCFITSFLCLRKK